LKITSTHLLTLTIKASVSTMFNSLAEQPDEKEEKDFMLFKWMVD
jgi:hypothetical protein